MDEDRFFDRLDLIRRGKVVFISHSLMSYYVDRIPFEDLPLYLGARVVTRIVSSSSITSSGSPYLGTIDIEWGSDRWDVLVRRRLYGSY